MKVVGSTSLSSRLLTPTFAVRSAPNADCVCCFTVRMISESPVPSATYTYPAKSSLRARAVRLVRSSSSPGVPAAESMGAAHAARALAARIVRMGREDREFFIQVAAF